MFESHMPDRSGFPSAVRGVGAGRFGLPSRVRGTPGSRGFAHWADASEAVKRRIPAQPRTRNMVASSIHAKTETRSAPRTYSLSRKFRYEARGFGMTLGATTLLHQAYRARELSIDVRSFRLCHDALQAAAHSKGTFI